LRLGKREIPAGIDIADFLLASGATPTKPVAVAGGIKK